MEMSPGLIKMWFSLGAIASMFIAVFTIMLSRYKLKGFLKVITAIIAYILVILAGLIMIFVVFSGPVNE
jgi:uncharacterized membrane protein YuzA (DUF378 family)